MKVKKFADVKNSIGGYSHWVENENGERKEVTENTIHYLWKKWITSKGCSREVEPNTSIMVFKTPKSLDI